MLRASKTCGADERSVEIENPSASKFADGGFSDIRAVPVPTIRLVSKPGSRSDHAVSLAGLVGARVFLGLMMLKGLDNSFRGL